MAAGKGRLSGGRGFIRFIEVYQVYWVETVETVETLNGNRSATSTV
jgi:hypothetical protein